ncbi:MAG: hypothetical protein AAFV01_09630, partial [Bacteroidota bacterium]
MRSLVHALLSRLRLAPSSPHSSHKAVDGVWLASLFAPLVLLVVVSRLMEMSNVGMIGLDGFLGRIWMYAPLPALPSAG